MTTAGRIVIALFALASAPAGAATTATQELSGASGVRGAFLARGMGARAVAMGEAYAAVADDATAASWNPGGLGQLDGGSVVAMYDNMGADLGVRYLAGALPLGRGVAGASVMMMNYGGYDVFNALGVRSGSKSLSDVAGTVTYAAGHPAWMKPGGWSGVTVEAGREAVGTSLWALSAGSVLPLTPGFTAGVALLHIGPTQDGVSLPAAARLGVSVDARDDLALVADVSRGLADKITTLSVGGEYSPLRRAALRLGYKRSSGAAARGGLAGLSAGLGARVGGVELDYAYQPVGDVLTSHRVALVFGGGR